MPKIFLYDVKKNSYQEHIYDDECRSTSPDSFDNDIEDNGHIEDDSSPIPSRFRSDHSPIQRNGTISIKLGKTASDNINIVRYAHPSYWWLHMDSVSSGHIIIETQILTSKIIECAAHLCYKNLTSKSKRSALYSKNSMRFFDIIVTQIQNLIYDQHDLEIGEVDFKNSSKKKLVHYHIEYKNDI